MKSLLALFSVLTVLALVSVGCHTVQGAGKDIQTVGEKGQEAIDPKGQK
jgi:predicted small secreted protein